VADRSVALCFARMLEPLAQEYLELVLAGRRQQASRLILEAVEAGTSVREVYLDVFQPVLREVGRLWEAKQVSIAQEHLCSAVTQLIMSQLYPRVFSAERRGWVMVATCLGGELHEIGVRMVADFFEMAGWDSYYLGANTPEDAVVDEVRRVGAHLLCVSITIPSHLPSAERLIQRVRREPGLERSKVLVGGAPFLSEPDLWRAIGADGTAFDADGAVATGTRLVQGG
jgi:MerR family transcriptional regulator, light-induced transcriptional regulator